LGLFANLKPWRRIRRALRLAGLLARPEKPKKAKRPEAGDGHPARPADRAPIRQPERVHLAGHINIINEGRLHIRTSRGVPHAPLDAGVPRVTLGRGVRILEAMRLGEAQEPLVWWIGVGTALGFSRDGGFIAGDSDIDVRVAVDFMRAEQARTLMAQLVDAFHREGFKLIREVYWDRRPMQSAFVDPSNGNIIFDIYFFHSGLTDRRLVNFNRANYREKPAHLIENRVARTWPGHPDITVYVPHPVEEYNEWRFGPEWRIKKKNSELTATDNRCLRPLLRGTVLTYGTFDIFHAGHARLLRRATMLGDRLIVGVVSDKLCRIKGKPIVTPEAQRAEAIASLECVDHVFIQVEMDQKEKDIERFDVKRLVVGDDWKDHPRFEQVRGYRGVEIVYLPRTPGISSTMLRASTDTTDRGREDASAGR
jgi:glycerol-3-phosphate cytidylyltransferase